MSSCCAAAHDHEKHDDKNELILSLLCGLILIITWGVSFFHLIPNQLAVFLYLMAYGCGGYHALLETIEEIRNREFKIDMLMLVAAIGAACIGQWAEGALLLFLFSMGHSLEHYAMGRARREITALAELAPSTAFVWRQNNWQEVQIESVTIGDRVLVKPNSRVPIDGLILTGESSVDESSITGESLPADKFPAADGAKSGRQNRLFAGTINGDGAIELSVEFAATDTMLARVIKMVREAESQKSPTQKFTDKFERIFVPIVLLSTFALLFVWLIKDENFSASFYRAMAFLIAASPCALAISTPSAVLSGIARAARQGILFKGGEPLELIGSVDIIAFDKTGTLTVGAPVVTDIVPAPDITEEYLLATAAAVEAQSGHPIARAILDAMTARFPGRHIEAAQDVHSVIGKGLTARIGDNEIKLGKPGFVFTGKNGPLNFIAWDPLESTCRHASLSIL